jgi:hypothetical protein
LNISARRRTRIKENQRHLNRDKGDKQDLKPESKDFVFESILFIPFIPVKSDFHWLGF